VNVEFALGTDSGIYFITVTEDLVLSKEIEEERYLEDKYINSIANCSDLEKMIVCIKKDLEYIQIIDRK
jgi:hypothetical protein